MGKPRSRKTAARVRAGPSTAVALLRLQRDLLKALGTVTDLRTGLARSLRAALAASGMDCGGIYLRDEASDGLALACQEGCPPDFVKATARFAADAPQTRLVLAGRSIVTTYDRLAGPKEGARRRIKLRCLAVIPFRRGKRVIGCLNLASLTRDTLPAGAMTAMEAVAAAIGGTVSRLRAEEKLRSSERRYADLLDSSSDGILVLDGDWRFTVINRAALTFLHQGRDDVLGKPITAVLPEIAEWPEFADISAAFAKRRRATVSGRYRLRDGRQGWYQVRLDPTPGGMLCVLRDITDAMNAGEALRQSESRFRMMADQAPLMIGIGNLTGNIVYLNKTWLDFRGKTLADESDWTWTADIHPDERAPVVSQMEEAVRRRVPLTVDFRIKNKSGEYRWLTFSVLPMKNAQGDPEGFIGTAFDVTENKRAVEALITSEARFRDLADLLPQMVFEIDRQGKVTYLNRKGLEIAGYSLEEMQSQADPSVTIDPADRELVARLLRDNLSGVKTEGTEYTIIRKDGSRLPVVSYAVPFYVDGEIRGVRGLVIDLTVQKAMERELAETRAMLEAAIAQTPIPMVLATAPDNVIRMVNSAALDLIGVKRGEELVGADLLGLEAEWEKADRQGVRTPVSKMPLALALRGIETRNALYSVRRRDGTTRWELVSGSPIRNRAGAIIAAFAVFPDVTETILAEEELSQRLAVERLAAEVSADFVNLYSEKIDEGITRGLKRIAEFSGAGCATLSLFAADGTGITNTNEWAGHPAASQFSRFPRNHLGLYAHYLDALRQNRTVAVSRSADYPAAALRNGLWLDENGFRSFLLTPLFRSGRLFGLLGLFGEIDREVQWSFHLVSLLGFIGDMIITLLDRRQTETELQIYREHLEELVARRTEELERSRQAAVSLVETATVQRQRAEEALAESTRMAEALKESQTRLRLATKSAEIGIVESDPTTGEMLWDETCAKIHGFPSDRPMSVEEYLGQVVHPEEQSAVRASLGEALASRSGHWGREYRIVRPGGEVRWITEDHVILRDDAGAATRMIGAKQDVTARNRAAEQIRQALVEKETLLREIHHRVKNNLNTISNLIYFQAKLVRDEEAIAAFRDSQNRIQSMARIHEHLYRSWDLSTVDMKAYLADLTVELAQTYGVKNARLDLECADIALDIDLAVPCGLIMSELVSNALKYAFPEDAPSNRIVVRLEKTAAGVSLGVSDNGRGLPAGWDAETNRTLGLRLVTMFTRQVSGTLTMRNAETGGAVFRIDLPGGGQGHPK